jgi:hypothetical protein
MLNNWVDGSDFIDHVDDASVDERKAKKGAPPGSRRLLHGLLTYTLLCLRAHPVAVFRNVVRPSTVEFNTTAAALITGKRAPTQVRRCCTVAFAPPQRPPASPRLWAQRAPV